jgi:hypothetical protein
VDQRNGGGERATLRGPEANVEVGATIEARKTAVSRP